MRWVVCLVVVVAACDDGPVMEPAARAHAPFRPIYPVHEFTSLTHAFARLTSSPAYEAYPTPAFLRPAGDPSRWINPADDVPLVPDARFRDALVDPTSRLAWVHQHGRDDAWYGPFALEL